MTRSHLTAALIVLIVSLAAPPTALACPICFGAVASPLLDSARMGVLTMVGVTLCVLGAFATWFLRLRKLSRSAGAQD